MEGNALRLLTGFFIIVCTSPLGKILPGCVISGDIPFKRRDVHGICHTQALASRNKQPSQYGKGKVICKTLYRRKGLIYNGKEGPTVVPIRTLYGRKRAGIPTHFRSFLFRNVFLGVSLQAATELDVILNSTKAIAHRGVTVYSELLFHRIITSNSTHSHNVIT